jgi:hypothetical protein
LSLANSIPNGINRYLQKKTQKAVSFTEKNSFVSGISEYYLILSEVAIFIQP